jgi:transcriptional antiterminator
MKYFSRRTVNNDKKAFQMIKLLIENDKLTTTQLSNLLDISSRQISNYKRYINDCLGIKINVTLGNQGGYSIESKKLNSKEISFLRDKLPIKLFNKINHINKLSILFEEDVNNGITNNKN